MSKDNSEVRTSVVKKDHGVDTVLKEETEIADHPPIKKLHAMVKVAFGQTISVGKFEFVRIDVGVEIPCDPYELDAGFEMAKDFVQEKFTEEVVAIKNQFAGKKE